MSGQGGEALIRGGGSGIGEAELVAPGDELGVGGGQASRSGHRLVSAPDHDAVSDLRQSGETGKVRGGHVKDIDKVLQPGLPLSQLVEQQNGGSVVHGG